MAQSVVYQQKSTTGRSSELDWKRLQLLFGASLSPALGERTATRLFLTPDRGRRTNEENELLARAHAFRVDGLAAWRWGSGPPVLLVHDWGGRGADLGGFVNPLIERGFSVVSFDAPAHGESPGLRATIGDFSDAVQAVSHRLGAPRAIVGHSFGGLASLLAVKRGVATKGLVVIAPPSPIQRLIAFQNTLDVPKEMFAGLRRRVEQRTRASFDDVEGGNLVRDLRVPGLVVHDTADGEADYRIGEEMARTWAGSSLHRTSGLGHQRIVTDPAVIHRVSDFIAQAR